MNVTQYYYNVSLWQHVAFQLNRIFPLFERKREKCDCIEMYAKVERNDCLILFLLRINENQLALCINVRLVFVMISWLIICLSRTQKNRVLVKSDFRIYWELNVYKSVLRVFSWHKRVWNDVKPVLMFEKWCITLLLKNT